MGKITEQETRQLASIIEKEGFYSVKSSASFKRYLDNAIEGFRNNELFTHLSGGTFDENVVKEILLSSYSAVAETSLTYADSPELNACAVWVPSGVFRANFRDFFSSGGNSLIKIGGPELLYRIIKYEKPIMDMKKALTNHNEWYLYNYECKPEVDSEEMFIKMVKPVVDYAWKTGRSCYVESSLESRISPLLKMGFHFVDKITVPKTNITVYSLMV